MTGQMTTRPTRRAAMFMTWASLAFIHWPLDIELARSLIPGQLELDLHDGQAWVGLVPFTMPVVRHRVLGGIPTMRRFHECNVRSYVRCGDERGVWFHSLDAASRLAVIGARIRWRLNYHHARIELDASDDDHRVSYRLQRLDQHRRGDIDQPGSHPRIARPGLSCAWQIGEARPPSPPGDLEHFLTERYGLFSLDHHGRVQMGRIAHRHWPLRNATLQRLDDASLVVAAGVPDEVIADVEPHVMAADAIDVQAWGLERM